MSNKSCFITVEGIEGVGKSTIIDYVKQLLNEASIDHVCTREPGGTDIAEAVRKVLLQKHEEIMSPDAELLLMFAGRAQNIAQVILPALQRGQWVISDRFTDASFAYQGGGRGIPLKHIAELAEWVQGDLQPDITLLLDAPVDIGFSRIQSRGIKDRIEQEGIEFFERVRERYLVRAAKYPERFHIINANQRLADVKKQVADIVVPAIEAFCV